MTYLQARKRFVCWIGAQLTVSLIVLASMTWLVWLRGHPRLLDYVLLLLNTYWATTSIKWFAKQRRLDRLIKATSLDVEGAWTKHNDGA